MEPIKSFRDLQVWQLSMDLNDEVIKAVRLLPREEFDLKRQMQNHVSIAMGSQGELDTQMEVCFRNDFLSRQAFPKILDYCDRVGAMLYKLHDSLD